MYKYNQTSLPCIHDATGEGAIHFSLNIDNSFARGHRHGDTSQRTSSVVHVKNCNWINTLK